MAIEINLKNYRCFSDAKPATLVLRKGFSALVGVNNAGKSSLLRFFYEFRDLFSRLSSGNGNFLNAIRGQPDSLSLRVLDTEEVFHNFNNRNLFIEMSFPHSQPVENESLNPTRVFIEMRHGSLQWTARFQTFLGTPQFPIDHPADFDQGILRLDGHPQVNMSNLWEASRKLANTLYIGPFRNAINSGASESYFDIPVGQSFIRAWKSYKYGPSKRQNEAAYEVTENIRKIFNLKDLEINASDNEQTLQVFIDGKSYKLPELGGGLAQFILVLTTAAIKRPSFILIDEPELNLHPSLQLDFLTTIGSYASEGVLFATHSMGLARASADQIYTVRKNSDGWSELTDLETTPRLSEFLGELSFSGYKELGFDKILLVEGATEVKAVQQLLRAFDKDHQVVLLPLGGSQLINASREAELQEIKRISNSILALIDSERHDANDPLSQDRAAFVAICQQIGIPCHVLERRALENYWSDRAVKQVKGDKYRALGPYELLKEVSPSWSKSENWRIARELTLDEIESTDLGRFLANL